MNTFWRENHKCSVENIVYKMQARSEKNTRPSCYLCETPKMPWSVIDSLPNLPEGNVVCRSCVNFEGVDR